jgi:hypothetical protein
MLVYFHYVGRVKLLFGLVTFGFLDLKLDLSFIALAVVAI